MYIFKYIHIYIFYDLFGGPACSQQGHENFAQSGNDSLLQQYVSEGPAFNQRRHQHVPHILPSLFKAGQGIFAEAASQLLAARSRACELLRSCSYAHTPCTWPSCPKTTTSMPRLAVKVSATYLKALEDPMRTGAEWDADQRI